MDKIRFIFPACLCFLALSLSRGEDLTTLDGHTFANITAIDKYSKLIVFTWNGTRK